MEYGAVDDLIAYTSATERVVENAIQIMHLISFETPFSLSSPPGRQVPEIKTIQSRGQR